MNNSRKVLTAILSLLFFQISARSQDSTLGHISKDTTIQTSDTLLGKMDMDSIDQALKELIKPEKSYFQASINYLNNNVYLGRKDTVLTPYITASLGYYHKSGLFISTSASYLPVSGQSRIDLVTIEAGYEIKTDKFEGQATFDKFFYSSQSNNVKAEMKASLAFFAGYDFGFIKPTATPTLNLSNSADFALTLGLEHTFYSEDNSFDITPTFNANGSTQNYYSSYYRNRKFKVKKKKVVTIQKGTVYGVVEGASQFKMLDYEFTLPVNYTIKKFTFNFTPTYAIPVHPAVVDITTQIANQPPKTRTVTEKPGNSFYWQAGVTLKF